MSVDLPAAPLLEPATTDAGASVDALVATLRSGQENRFGLLLPTDVDLFNYYGSASIAEILRGAEGGDGNAAGTEGTAGSALQSVEPDTAVTGIAEAVERDPATIDSLATSLSETDADRLLALIRQDMAVFGAQASDNPNPALRNSLDKPIDFFA